MYRLFNDEDSIVCERFFLPPKQELAELIATRAPLLTLESQTPVGEFDVIAFSVSFEWDYVNVLTLLRLAGVPARAAERTERHPLVVIGGAVTFVNPEPLALFADVIAAGEGEAMVPALSRSFSAASGRADLLQLLAQERGFYVPSFYEPEYAADGTLARYVLRPGIDPEKTPLPVRKAALKTTEAVDPPATASSPHTGRRGSSSSRPWLREPVPLLLGWLQLPARSRFRPIASCSWRGAGAFEQVGSCPSRLRPPGDRADPGAAVRNGLLHQPGVAAPGRPYRTDRPCASRERRAHHHHRAGNRIRSAAACDQQNRDERRDSRSGRSHLRERHREPEAVLHDRPPYRD
jgi:hypothetical protein